MISIYKSYKTHDVYVNEVTSSFGESFNFVRAGDFFDIYSYDNRLREISKIHYSNIEGKDELGNTINFTSANNLENYLNSIFSDIEIVDVNNKVLYKPTLNIISLNTNIIPTNSTNYQLEINGEFLDYVCDVNLTGTITGNINVTIISQNFNTLVLQFSTNSNLENLSLDLITANSTTNLTLQTQNVTEYTPNVGVSSPELWVKSGGNNAAQVSLGTFDAQNSNGNGWNEHAYFGAFTSATRLEFQFNIEELTLGSSAYCFIRFNNTNNPSTSGTPRIYISDGTNFFIYNANNSSTNDSVSENDLIKVVLTPNSFEVFKNGQLIYNDNLSYNLNNVYCTFTAYRYFKATNIVAKEYN